MTKENKKKEKPVKDEKESFLNEISEKINKASSISDLKALNKEVFDIWGDSVPAEIQALAAKRGEEIQNEENGSVEPPEIKEFIEDGWKKCTLAEAKEAEKAGTLAGYDPDKGIALIKEKK